MKNKHKKCLQSFFSFLFLFSLLSFGIGILNSITITATVIKKDTKLLLDRWARQSTMCFLIICIIVKVWALSIVTLVISNNQIHFPGEIFFFSRKTHLINRCLCKSVSIRIIHKQTVRLAKFRIWGIWLIVVDVRASICKRRKKERNTCYPNEFIFIYIAYDDKSLIFMVNVPLFCAPDVHSSAFMFFSPVFILFSWILTEMWLFSLPFIHCEFCNKHLFSGRVGFLIKLSIFFRSFIVCILHAMTSTQSK